MWQVAGDEAGPEVPSPTPQLTCDDLLRLKLSLQACLARLTGTRWAIET